MMYGLIFVLLFFLPGWFLVQLLQIRKFAFLLAFAFSYALLALMLLLLICWRAPIWLFDGLVSLAVALAAGGLAVGYWRRRRRQAADQPRNAGWGRRCRARLPVYGVAGAIVAGVVAYLGYAGPYTEIPADVWAHLARVQTEMTVVQSGHFMCNVPVRQMLTHQSSYWYLLLGWMHQRFGFDLSALLWPVTLANVLTFLLGYYFLALYVFRHVRLPRAAKCGMAGCAALFAALTLGVNVFAYIRYYALAPTILNAVLYLAVTALFLEYLRSPKWITGLALAVPVLLWTMCRIHSQEALLACFMMLGLVICECWRAWHRRPDAILSLEAGKPFPASGRRDWRRAKTTVLLLAAIGLYAGLFLGRQPLAPRAIPDYFLISLQRLAPFLKTLYIVPPAGQFYEVLTLWGVFVYLLFFLNLREFSRSPYILAGMLMPLLTVFNPLTVDLLMRLGVAPTVLYRLVYLLPLPLVAGCLLVKAVSGLGRAGTGKRAWQENEPAGLRRPWCSGLWRRVSAGLVCVGLIGLLFPIHAWCVQAPYSRLYTLRRIPPANDQHLWADLINFIQGFKDQRIIADRVTGYVLAGLTANIPLVGWFHYADFEWWLAGDGVAKPFDELFIRVTPEYGWLLVVNERDGGFSVNGAISRHWPGDILKVSRFYSPAMKAYVADHPERFRLIWNQNRIRVYKVVTK